jgi:transposase
VSPEAILRAYKEQNGVEMNFRFLKDPVIVNSTFLKKAERIEALGFILLLSLMIWNLMQQVMREHLKEHQKSIRGWDKKQTYKPTCLMVIFHFQHISISKWNQGRSRRLSRDLLSRQRDYLQALGLPETIFTIPVKSIRKGKN